MPIKILKEGLRVECLYRGTCGYCNCEFELPRIEAERHVNFRSTPLVKNAFLPCPNCAQEVSLYELDRKVPNQAGTGLEVPK